MKRPWLVWLAFGGCLAVLVAALAWLSLTTLRQEQAHLLAGQQAALEEKVRLALWRMDSTLTPLIVQESSRPFFAYVPADGPTQSPKQMLEAVGAPPGLHGISPARWYGDATNVLLHFQYDPVAGLSSPQVAGPLPVQSEASPAAERLATLREIINPTQLLISCATTLPAAVTSQPEPMVALQGRDPKAIVGQAKLQQQIRNQIEQNARAQSYEQAVAPPQLSSRVAQGAIRPVWIGSALVLARRVTVNEQEHIQGCWLDWPQIQQSMLASIRDLLPQATLEPIPAELDDPQGRRLASLPVRLNPGLASVSPKATPSPVRQALLIAWPCLLLAAAAVGLLLHGALSLSERRGAFVSAVTHELRTPLTTFKMYSEMLAEDMVTDPAKRQQYLQTLNREAGRLHHLVENVLAYARLEKGSARRQIETLTVGELLDRLQPRLDERAAQAGLQVKLETSAETRAVRLTSDPTAIEQILFNLVDNACKYAAPSATEPVLELKAWTESRFLCLSLSDHGPGLSREVTRSLFRPFSKSDQEAAQTAPGVGLGLSLCRRLSRSLKGDLKLESGRGPGASFLLRIPLGQ